MTELAVPIQEYDGLTWKDMDSLNVISGVLRAYGHENLANILLSIQCKCTDIVAAKEDI